MNCMDHLPFVYRIGKPRCRQVRNPIFCQEHNIRLHMKRCRENMLNYLPYMNYQECRCHWHTNSCLLGGWVASPNDSCFHICFFWESLHHCSNQTLFLCNLQYFFLRG